MSETVLYDVQGPRARRRVLLGSVVAGLLLLGLLVLVAVRLEGNGQFDERLYRPFIDQPALYERLWEGLKNTLKAAGYALVLASVLGVLLAFVLDFLDDTLKSSADVERFVGLTTLGAIPTVES